MNYCDPRQTDSSAFSAELLGLIKDVLSNTLMMLAVAAIYTVSEQSRSSELQTALVS